MKSQYLCTWFNAYTECDGLQYGVCDLMTENKDCFSTAITIPEGINPVGKNIDGTPFVLFKDINNDIRKTTEQSGFYPRKYVGKLVQKESQIMFEIKGCLWDIYCPHTPRVVPLDITKKMTVEDLGVYGLTIGDMVEFYVDTEQTWYEFPLNHQPINGIYNSILQAKVV